MDQDSEKTREGAPIEGAPIDRAPRGGLRGPLLFGIVAATLEMGAVLALLYC